MSGAFDFGDELADTLTACCESPAWSKPSAVSQPIGDLPIVMSHADRSADFAFGGIYPSGRYRARTCDPQRVMLVR
jgi:hypothetical protein